MPRSLRAQVQALSVLPILGLGAVAICVSLVLTQQEVSQEASRNLQEVSHLLAATTRERSLTLQTQANLVANLPSLRIAMANKDPETIADRVRFFVNRTQADALIVTDDSGRMISQVGKVKGKTFDRDLKTLILRAADGKSAIGIVSQGGHLYAAASTPITSGSSTYTIGTLTALCLVGDSLAKQLRGGTSADLIFLWKGQVVGSSLPIRRLPKVGRLTPSRITLKGTQYVALATALPGSNPKLEADVVALRRYSDLAGPYQAFGSSFIMVLLVGLLIAGLFSRAVANGILKPLESLARSAQVVRDGSWPEALAVERQDEIGLLQSVFNDMTANLKKSTEQMLGLVDTDTLTGLNNHRKFKERLDQEVFRACMSNKPLILALIDIDRFAEYNEKFGHAGGDHALKTMAALLNDVSPDIAFLARYAGEEFAVMLPLNNLEGAEAIMQRLRELLQGKFQAPLTISVGIADVSTGASTGAALLLSAELALSRAKQLGRDRICRFDAVPGASSSDDPFQLQKFLQDSTLATIQALAGAVDAKDPYTQGHSVRVARYASDLAKYMGYPEAFVDLVYKTGTLHDVGKIGVPDSILAKPGRLEPEEQAIMETHPVLGELIVKKAPQLQEMLSGVRHHHERWDGRGYPDGIMGQKIPLLARFIAVADTFDAMTSNRPYRVALPENVALDEIKRGGGHQFDPEVAEEFVRMMKLHGYQRAA
ncbi:MAG: hypothetical protein QOJ65_2081 [Fimbriimonadaceae bacterium]|jgi:diguanylate cyclase (GGDEF)-like protein|nr:hypothetical protein [Fimbriimonadaceae bacterium]